MNLIKNHATTAAIAHLVASAAPLHTKDGGDPLALIAKKFGDHTAEVMTKLGASNEQLAELKARLDEFEQKAARQGPAADHQPDTLGKQFAENPEVKSFSEYQARPSRFSMNMKATITNATTSAGALGTTARDTTVIMPTRRLTVRDLLPVIRVTDNSVEYPNQATRVNNAAPVAEGAAKPESDYTFELKNTPIRTLAHWVAASRQVLSDIPQLQGIIDSELLYGLKLLEENQLLNGDGTGQNLSGLIPNATAYAATPGVVEGTPNAIDTLGLAILQNSLADLPADGIVVHSADWMKMRLIKNADGEYILGNPATSPARVLFGLPVVDTPAMSQGNFLVGQFQTAATLYDRWEARIEVSTEHADFFTRNLVAILCEERIGLAVKRAKALTYGAFPTGE